MKSFLFSGRNSVTLISFKLVIVETSGLPRRAVSTTFPLFRRTTIRVCNHSGYYTIRLINQLPTGAFSFLISIMQLICFLFLAQFHRGEDAKRMLTTCCWFMSTPFFWQVQKRGPDCNLWNYLLGKSLCSYPKAMKEEGR